MGIIFTVMNGLKIKDPSRFNIILYSLALSGFGIGYGVGIMNSLAEPVLALYFKLTPEERVGAIGNLNFFYPMGAVIGMIFAGKLISTFGRRKANLILDVGVIISLIVVVFGSLSALYISRFLFGITSSLYSVVAGLTMVECFPTDKASIGNMGLYVSITSFLLLVFVQQTIFDTETLVNHWRLFMSYPAILAVVRLYLLNQHLDFESPVQIVSKFSQDPNLKSILKENLTKLYEDDEALDQKLNELVTKAKCESGAKEATLQEFLTHPMYRKAMISSLIVAASQNMTGINFLVFFSTQLFDSISGNGKMISVVFGVGNLAGGLLGVYVVNRFTRKWLLEKGAIAQGISMWLMVIGIATGVYFHLSFCVLLYVFTYALGLGATMALYLNEVPPAVGAGFATSVAWATAALVGKICPIGVYYFGSTAVLIFFASCCFAVSYIIKTFCMESPANQPKELEIDNTKELEEKLAH
jgi:MFS family permease